MAALKITERKTDWLERDPYELFELAESPQATRGKAEFYGAVVVGALIATVISLAIVWSFYRVDQDDQIQPYAYLEVKAIDPEGRPVVGALVKTDGERAGITDAFGEWRRFMKVPLGGRVSLTMMKRDDVGMLSSVKTLQVPSTMPDTGDIEVVDRVRLTYLDGVTPPAEKPAAESVATTIAANEPAPTVAAENSLGADTHVTFAADDQRPEAEVASRDFNRVWIMADSTDSADLTATQSDAPGTKTYLHTQVLAALRQRARQLGLVVDPQAAWRISVRHIQVPGAKGLIQTRAAYQQSPDGQVEHLYSFLTNYLDTPVDAARSVMYRISQYTPVDLTAYRRGNLWYIKKPESPLWQRDTGSLVMDSRGSLLRIGPATLGTDHILEASAASPCAEQSCRVRALTVPQGSPKTGWEILPLRLHGDKGRKLDVYVSGIAAVPVSPGIFNFWGAPDQAANLTVLVDHQVIHRGKITASRAQGAQVSLSVGTISRR